MLRSSSSPTATSPKACSGIARPCLAQRRKESVARGAYGSVPACFDEHERRAFRVVAVRVALDLHETVGRRDFRAHLAEVLDRGLGGEEPHGLAGPGGVEV